LDRIAKKLSVGHEKLLCENATMRKWRKPEKTKRMKKNLSATTLMVA
jgi:hypothetical protein